MLLDARNLGRRERLDFDVCIVGAGPAGLTVADALAGHSARVGIVESGGSAPDRAVQSLGEGLVRGDVLGDLVDSRRRQVGGTANAWQQGFFGVPQGVRFVPLDPLDFETREWLPHSGWPFCRAELDPYYERAHLLLGLGDFAYDAMELAGEASSPLEIADEIVTRIFRFGPRTVFTRAIPERIRKAQSDTLVTHATVTAIRVDVSGTRVERLDVVDSAGKPFSIGAHVVVLAAGGIENARLLLLSRGRHERGIGNQHDVVGRYFMEHPLVRGGVLTPRERSLFAQLRLYDQRDAPFASTMAYLELAPQVRLRERLLHMTWLLFPRPVPRKVRAVRSLSELRSARIRDPRVLIRRAAHVIAGSDFLATALVRRMRTGAPLLPHVDWGGWSTQTRLDRRFATFDVLHQTEQAPHPDNRLVLAKSCDRFGLPQPELRWRWRDTDIDSVARSQELFASYVRASGLGSLVLERSESRPVLEQPGTHHHLGTTRMHVDPRLGVVDADCRVHGVANLFVAGSSLFPTGGFANPTLTIVALGLRLADQLRRVLG